MKIAAVIKLKNKVSQKINRLKKKFKKKFNKWLYIDDFPHITLLSASFDLSIHKIRQLNFEINSKPIKINVAKPNIFQNDKLTGGTTFYYNIKNNKKLSALQINTSNIFKKYLSKNQNLNLFNKNSLEQKSLKKYGFPYVGIHWIPHISICSVLDKKINSKEIKNFLNSRMHFTFNVDEILLCIVHKKKLKIIKKVKFKE